MKNSILVLPREEMQNKNNKSSERIFIFIYLFPNKHIDFSLPILAFRRAFVPIGVGTVANLEME
jgi:hypothetical protein